LVFPIYKGAGLAAAPTYDSWPLSRKPIYFAVFIFKILSQRNTSIAVHQWQYDATKDGTHLPRRLLDDNAGNHQPKSKQTISIKKGSQVTKAA
jgi:hypothetical protein